MEHIPQTIVASVRYDAADDEITLQRSRWGSNDDPRGLLSPGTLYDVAEIEVHSMHTKLHLVGFPGKKFNSSHFTFADEGPLEAAREEWRNKRRLF